MSGPTPLAAKQGNTITVEDLFYNVPTRLAALRSSAEVFNKIADVVTKYAIHNAGVGFALKKMGEVGVDVKTTATSTVVDNIRTVYGPSVAKELIEFSLEEKKLKFRATPVGLSTPRSCYLVLGSPWRCLKTRRRPWLPRTW